MSATSQITLNHSLLEEQDHDQMGFLLPFPANLTFPPLVSHQSSKPFTSIAPPSLLAYEAADHSTSNLAQTLLQITSQKSRQDLISTFGGAHQFLSLHRSSVNPCKRSGVDDHQIGIFDMKMKKIKGRRKVREPRFSFKTMSDVDVLDDGYKWRKYGQKVVKNTQHPRSYYRCTQDNCRVKKRVERLAEDPRMVITTYEGRHAHSPSNDLEVSETQSQLSNFVW